MLQLAIYLFISLKHHLSSSKIRSDILIKRFIDTRSNKAITTSFSYQSIGYLYAISALQHCGPSPLGSKEIIYILISLHAWVMKRWFMTGLSFLGFGVILLSLKLLACLSFYIRLRKKHCNGVIVSGLQLLGSNS